VPDPAIRCLPARSDPTPRARWRAGPPEHTSGPTAGFARTPWISPGAPSACAPWTTAFARTADPAHGRRWERATTLRRGTEGEPPGDPARWRARPPGAGRHGHPAGPRDRAVPRGDFVRGPRLGRRVQRRGRRRRRVRAADGDRDGDGRLPDRAPGRGAGPRDG